MHAVIHLRCLHGSRVMSSACVDDDTALHLWELPSDALALVLCHLVLRTRLDLRRVCRRLRDAVDDDAVWALPFTSRWPAAGFAGLSTVVNLALAHAVVVGVFRPNRSVHTLPAFRLARLPLATSS